MATTPSLRLHNANLDLTISPLNGGGIVSFEAFGEQVLLPAPTPIENPTDPACFVLVPYCNRIAEGQAAFEGRPITLAANLEGEVHPLHGEGWLSEWQVEASNGQNADLTYAYQPSAGKWPWAFEATQRYELTGNRLRHVLKIQNSSDSPMPAGLGFHPYFPKAAGDTFEAEVSGIWQAGEDRLPTVHALASQAAFWPHGQFKPEVELDHCFTDWNGELTIRRKNLNITLRASRELGLLHVYAPPGSDFFCAEPVSHMPNALNHGEQGFQMQVLVPGESFDAEVVYLIEKPA